MLISFDIDMHQEKKSANVYRIIHNEQTFYLEKKYVNVCHIIHKEQMSCLGKKKYANVYHIIHTVFLAFLFMCSVLEGCRV